MSVWHGYGYDNVSAFICFLLVEKNCYPAAVLHSYSELLFIFTNMLNVFSQCSLLLLWKFQCSGMHLSMHGIAWNVRYLGQCTWV